MCRNDALGGVGGSMDAFTLKLRWPVLSSGRGTWCSLVVAVAVAATVESDGMVALGCVYEEEGSWDLGVFGKCPENEYTSSDKTGVTLVYWARTD